MSAIMFKEKSEIGDVMKKGLIGLLVLALAGAGAGGGYYYWSQIKGSGAETAKVSSDSADAVYVDSVGMLAGISTGSNTIARFAGVVEPQKTWEVKLENEKTVKKCYVKEGEEVKEGQKLFDYNTSEDQDKLDQAKIDLERCQNDLESSKVTKEQLEKEKAKASADDILSYTTRILSEENSIKQSEYEYKTKELEIKQLEEAIKNSTVLCEMDGVIQSIKDPNDNSSVSDSSDSAYITVLALGDYRVKGTVNEQNVNQINEGMDMIVHSRVDDTMTWHGTISEINRDKGETNSESSYGYGGSSGGNNSTNYPFYVELESSDQLMLGQHVYMEVNQGQELKKDGIWIDDYYFADDEETGEKYVWAASKDNLLEKRKVTLGEYDDAMCTYEVLDGLTADDYITVPSEELKEGLPVIYNDFSQTPDDLGSYDSGEFGEDIEDLEGGEFDGETLDGMGSVDGGIQSMDDGMMNGEDIYNADVEDAEVYNADSYDEGDESYDDSNDESYDDSMDET